MWQKCTIVLILILVNASAFTFAQQNSETIDSTLQWHTIKNDSTALYRIIEAYSKRSLITDFAYGLVFKPVKVDTLLRISKIKFKQSQKP